MLNKWQNWYLCITSQRAMNCTKRIPTLSKHTACTHTSEFIFLLPSHQSWAFQNGGACNWENKVHFGAACFWGTAGVCVGWELCQGGGLQLSHRAEKLYFQQYSLITQALHRACFYPHTLILALLQLWFTLQKNHERRRISQFSNISTFATLFSINCASEE